MLSHYFPSFCLPDRRFSAFNCRPLAYLVLLRTFASNFEFPQTLGFEAPLRARTRGIENPQAHTNKATTPQSADSLSLQRGFHCTNFRFFCRTFTSFVPFVGQEETPVEQTIHARNLNDKRALDPTPLRPQYCDVVSVGS